MKGSIVNPGRSAAVAKAVRAVEVDHLLRRGTGCCVPSGLISMEPVSSGMPARCITAAPVMWASRERYS